MPNLIAITFTNNDHAINDLITHVDGTDPEHIIVTGKDDAGILRFELHFNSEGQLHNPSGPSSYEHGYRVMDWHENEGTSTEIAIHYSKSLESDNAYKKYSWYKHDVLHNLTGPAHIIEYTDIKRNRTLYVVDGVGLSKNIFLKKYKPDEWKKEQLARTFRVCGKKYRISSMTNDKLIMEKVK